MRGGQESSQEEELGVGGTPLSYDWQVRSSRVLNVRPDDFRLCSAYAKERLQRTARRAFPPPAHVHVKLSSSFQPVYERLPLTVPETLAFLRRRPVLPRPFPNTSQTINSYHVPLSNLLVEVLVSEPREVPVDDCYDFHPFLQEADDVLRRVADPRPVKESAAIGVGAKHAARVAGNEGRVLGDSARRRDGGGALVRAWRQSDRRNGCGGIAGVRRGKGDGNTHSHKPTAASQEGETVGRGDADKGLAERVNLVTCIVS